MHQLCAFKAIKAPQWRVTTIAKTKDGFANAALNIPDSKENVNSSSCIGQMEKIIKSPSHHYCIKDVVAQGKVLQFPLSFLEGNNHIIDKMKAIVSEKPNNC